MEIKTCKSMLNHWENPTHSPLFQKNIKGHSGSLTNVPIIKEINPKVLICAKNSFNGCQSVATVYAGATFKSRVGEAIKKYI